jgi:hypothetical protein
MRIRKQYKARMKRRKVEAKAARAAIPESVETQTAT